MELPKGILQNTEAALALFSAFLAIGGIALCLGAYAAFFLFTQNLDLTVSAQIDAYSAVILDAKQAVLSTAAGTASANGAISNISNALGAYSESAKGMGDSLATVGAIPPFSLDSRISSSAAKLREASGYFSGAASSLNSSSLQIGSAGDSLKKMALDLDGAGNSLSEAKQGFKSALSALNVATLVGTLALCALFSANLLLALSMLLSHYPRFFDKKESKE